MATYLLIHGAWHTKWAWEYVRPLFPKNHTILTLDLPGRGEHKKALKNISLKTYVDYIIETINTLPEKVVLVGHSMAGMVISQVAELVPDRIERLSYVAAFVPCNGENVLGIGGAFSRPGVSTEMIWQKSNHRVDLKQSELLQNLFFNACTPELAHQGMQLLVPEPMRPFLDPVHLSQEKFGRVEKQYIECLKDQTISIEDQRCMQRKMTCSVASLSNADHSPFYSTPHALVKILIGE